LLCLVPTPATADWDASVTVKLNGTAHEAGVKRFGIFHGAGIQAMYELRLTEIRARRGLNEKEDWLDRQGAEELAANDFRITQTEAKMDLQRAAA
jgi:DNA-damage-inducible protein D